MSEGFSVYYEKCIWAEGNIKCQGKTGLIHLKVSVIRLDQVINTSTEGRTCLLLPQIKAVDEMGVEGAAKESQEISGAFSTHLGQETLLGGLKTPVFSAVGRNEGRRG